MKKLIITLPAKNEAQSLGAVINGIRNALQNIQYEWEIIVIDDASDDNTGEVCRTLNVHCKRLPVNYGLAETFRMEMKECLRKNADIIVHIDADGQYAPVEIPNLLRKIEEGYDLVLGSRFMGTIEEMPKIKKWGNKAFSKVVTRLAKQKITDGQTGFRAFTKEVAENVIIRSSHTYTQEQIIRASRQHFKIGEVPATFKKRAVGKSRLLKNPFEYAIKAWINLIRTYRDFEPLKFFGIIGLVLLGLSIPLIIRLIYFYFQGTTESHMLSTVIGALLIISGLQIILFGFLADMKKE